MDPSSINWQELTATAAMCGVFVWGIVKGLPTFYARVAEDQTTTREVFTAALTHTRESFSESLSSQRSEFRDDLRATREQSRQLAQAGHEAVNRNTAAVDQLTEKVEKSLNQNGN
jgi:uncharacterized membrane protein